MMKNRFTVLVALVAIALPFCASAETVVRTGEEVGVARDQIIENDFYALAGTIAMSGEVAGDMYAAGGSVTTNGEVKEDLVIAAGSANVHAPVADDVRSFSGETIIAEHVGGDVFVLGGTLKILSTASVDGNVYFHGGELTVEGNVAGSVIGAAGDVRIDSALGGDIDMTIASTLTLGDRASVEGDVKHTGGQLNRSQNAVVVGDVIAQSLPTPDTTPNTRMVWLPFIISLFSTLVVYLLAKNELTQLVATTKRSTGVVSLVGLAVLLFAPVLALFLLVTVLGSLLGLFTLALLMLALLLAFILMPVVVGGLIATAFSAREPVNLIWIVVGAVAVKITGLIPVIGPFALFVIFVMSLGAIVYRLYTRISKK